MTHKIFLVLDNLIFRGGTSVTLPIGLDILNLSRTDLMLHLPQANILPRNDTCASEHAYYDCKLECIGQHWFQHTNKLTHLVEKPLVYNRQVAWCHLRLTTPSQEWRSDSTILGVMTTSESSIFSKHAQKSYFSPQKKFALIFPFWGAIFFFCEF